MPVYKIDPTSKQSQFIREKLEQLVSQRNIAKELGIPRTTLTKHIKRIRDYDTYLKQLEESKKRLEEDKAFTFIADDDIYGKWLRAMKLVSERSQNEKF